MKRWQRILILVLLLLSLLGNGGLLWLYGSVAPQTSRLQQELARQSQELAQQLQELGLLREERDKLLGEVRTLNEEKSLLEQQLTIAQSRPDMFEEWDRLESEVRTQRQLVPQQAVPRDLVSVEELRARVAGAFVREYPQRQASTEAQVLVLLGLLDTGTSLSSIRASLYTVPTSSFYDLGRGRLAIVGSANPSPLEQLSFVHSYVHALQDQLFDLGKQVEAVSEDSDRKRALQALSEGDAVLAMQQYILDHREASTPGLLSQTLDISAPSFSTAPTVVQRQLLFPYQAGLALVLPLYEKRGWAAVDAVWGDPPQSTEQILHPQRYPDDAPEVVSLVALTTTLGEGWRFQGEDTLGEFMLRQHLALYLDEKGVDRAATGWGGDRYALYIGSQGSVCLLLRLVWDDRDEADEFVELYQTYANARYGVEAEGTAIEGMWWDGAPGLYLEQTRDETWLIWAPDQETAQEVARKIR